MLTWLIILHWFEKKTIDLRNILFNFLHILSLIWSGRLFVLCWNWGRGGDVFLFFSRLFLYLSSLPYAHYAFSWDQTPKSFKLVSKKLVCLLGKNYYSFPWTKVLICKILLPSLTNWLVINSNLPFVFSLPTGVSIVFNKSSFVLFAIFKCLIG